jgi:hypothetical protein
MKFHRSLFTLALVAAMGGGLALTACSTEVEPPNTETPDPEIVATNVELRQTMHVLWTDHALWTRVFLVSAIDGLPDQAEATQRLLKNQADIADAIRPLYGDAAADQLETLLTTHITQAADLLGAVRSGDAQKTQSAKDAWYANAEEIATFLSDAMPSLPRDEVSAMMRTHLDQTLAEAGARLEGHTDDEIASYDAIVSHLRHLGDAIATGAAARFPDKVAADPRAPNEQELAVAMRDLWLDHVSWTRLFLIEAVADRPGASATADRLFANQVAIGDAVKPYYGAEAGDALTGLLHDHIAIAAELVGAAKAGDSAAVEDAKARWYANADEIAAFLAKANPNWDGEHLKTHMRDHLDKTLEEATARLTGNWSEDIAAYDVIVADITHLADELSSGLAKQFPSGPAAL